MSENKIKEKLYLKGLKAFENHEFYDAHEFWEDLWSDYRLPDAKFIQGLIQLSVGYFHITNNNRNGALGLLKKSINKFELYRPEYRSINIKHILLQIDKSIYAINHIEHMKNFDWSLVPSLKSK